MKLTIEGTPEEIAAFLAARAATVAPEILPAPAIPAAAQAEPAAEPREKPPAQTIEPMAIERLEFGVDQAGMPVDVAAVHRAIGELLKNAAFQRAAAANMPPLDAFEAPMMHAKRFLMAHCVRDNQFNLAALDVMCHRYLSSEQQACETFIAAKQPHYGQVNVTFEENK